MRVARLQHSLLLAIAAAETVNLAALHGFNSGVATILGGNRDATDAELLGLENLTDQVLHSEPAEAEPGEEELPPSGGEQPGVGSSEAGGDLSPSDANPVTGIAPSEASPEAPAEPAEQLTEVQPAPILPPHEELFQPQTHDEDDGA